MFEGLFYFIWKNVLQHYFTFKKQGHIHQIYK